MRVADDLDELRLDGGDRFVAAFLRGVNACLRRDHRGSHRIVVGAAKTDYAFGAAPRHAACQVASKKRLVLQPKRLPLGARCQHPCRR